MLDLPEPEMPSSKMLDGTPNIVLIQEDEHRVQRCDHVGEQRGSVGDLLQGGVAIEEHAREALEDAGFKHNGTGLALDIRNKCVPLADRVVDELVTCLKGGHICGMVNILLAEPDRILTLALQLTRQVVSRAGFTRTGNAFKQNQQSRSFAARCSGIYVACVKWLIVLDETIKPWPCVAITCVIREKVS